MAVGNVARRFGIVVAVVGLGGVADGAIRVVSYNIASDVDDTTAYGASNGLPSSAAVRSVFTAIGKYTLAGNAQPADVIGLEELYRTPTTTLASVVADLNAVYGANTYAYAAGVSTTTGNSNVGNGPSGLIYNTKTVQVTGFANIGTASGDGAARTPSRYTLQAVGGGAASTFYMYVEHAKSPIASTTGTTSPDRRTIEADSVRSDADVLPAGAHAIFTGDFNLAGGSSERAYQDLTAAAGTALFSGATAGVGRAVDPIVSTFAANSANVRYATESATGLTARFDFQLVTGNVLAAANQAGLQLVANSYAAFGHTYYNGSGLLATSDVYNRAITALADNGTGVSLADRTYLTQLSDHLPVISDYIIAVPEPGSMAVYGVVVGLAMRRRRASPIVKQSHFT